MQNVKGQTKSASVLCNKWFNSFRNIEIWSCKNYHQKKVDLQNLFPDIEIDSLQLFFFLIFSGESFYCVFFIWKIFVVFYYIFVH